MADLQPEIPQEIEHELDRAQRRGRRLVRSQEQQVDVAERRQHAAAVAAGGRDGETIGGDLGGLAHGVAEQRGDQPIHQSGEPPRRLQAGEFATLELRLHMLLDASEMAADGGKCRGPRMAERGFPEPGQRFGELVRDDCRFGRGRSGGGRFSCGRLGLAGYGDRLTSNFPWLADPMAQPAILARYSFVNASRGARVSGSIAARASRNGSAETRSGAAVTCRPAVASTSACANSGKPAAPSRPAPRSSAGKQHRRASHHRLRHAGQPGDMHAPAPSGRALRDLVQEHDAALPFLHPHRVRAQPRQSAARDRQVHGNAWRRSCGIG